MALTKKPLSLSTLVLNTFRNVKVNWYDFMIIFLFVCLLVVVSTTLWVVIYYGLIWYGLIFFNSIIIFNLFWNIIASLTSLVIAAITNILIINKLLSPEIPFKANLKAIKKYFWRFACLHLIIYLLVLIAAIPLYATVIFYMFNIPVLGVISIALSFVILVILVTYFVFSPFILIDKNTSCIESLRKSKELSKGNFFNLLLKLLVVSIISLIIDVLSIAFVYHSMVGILVGVILFIILVIFIYNFLFSLYQSYNRK